jgi:alanine racemase
MDYITVDVGDAPVGLGDEATFFGSADGAPSSAERRPGVPVEEVAEAAGTIAYELLVRVGGRVPRRLVGAL